MLDIPPHIERMIITRAEEKGITVDELLLQAFAQDDEHAYYDWFYKHHFDIEKLSQAIGEYDENGCAKNTITIPKGLAKNKDAFREWVKANAS